MYCVYYHRNPETREIVYIGSGRYNRANNFSGRSLAWNQYKRTNEIVVDIVHRDLTLTEAREIETQLIAKYKPVLNQRKPIVKHLSLEGLSDLLEYSETSATFLKWKVTGGARAKVGQDAGTLTFDSSKRPRAAYVKILGVSYKISRLVYFLTYGEDPKNLIVDHKDGNPHNNQMQNLRLVTYQENSCNRDCKGIFYRPKTTSKSSESWLAHVTFNSKRYSKTFSVAKYGFDTARNMAISWRQDKCNELNHTEGASFTERHSKLT